MDDEVSDLETISQLLSERAGIPNKNSNNGNKAAPRNSPRGGSNVSDMRKKIEKQLDNTSKQPRPKPSPNAVPVGFRDENGNMVFTFFFSSQTILINFI
jgi:hypothetical protein